MRCKYLVEDFADGRFEGRVVLVELTESVGVVARLEIGAFRWRASTASVCLMAGRVYSAPAAAAAAIYGWPGRARRRPAGSRPGRDVIGDVIGDVLRMPSFHPCSLLAGPGQAAALDLVRRGRRIRSRCEGDVMEGRDADVMEGRDAGVMGGRDVDAVEGRDADVMEGRVWDVMERDVMEGRAWERDATWQARAHTHARTHTHARARARAGTATAFSPSGSPERRYNSPPHLPPLNPHTHADTRTHTRARARTHTHTHTHAF